MHFISITFTPVQQAFPTGTAQDPYTITVTKPDGTDDTYSTTTVPFQTTTAYDDGDYAVAVTANGVQTTGKITLSPDTVQLNVPGPLTLTAVAAA